MTNNSSFSELVLGFSKPSYTEREGVSVIMQVIVKSGKLSPSLTVEVLFANSNGTAIGFICI